MIKKLLYIIPECYVDTNLIEYLVDAHVNHQHSCTKVVKLLNVEFRDRFSIGIIDRDKVEMGYIRDCDVIASTCHLNLLKHKQRKQYLITICPAVDRLILDCAQDKGVDLAIYGLPSKLKDFTHISKSVTSNSDSRFKLLFKDIDDCREIRNLRNSLQYMVQNTYATDNEVLIKKFEEP